jgi:hypothetical protein
VVLRPPPAAAFPWNTLTHPRAAAEVAVDQSRPLNFKVTSSAYAKLVLGIICVTLVFVISGYAAQAFFQSALPSIAGSVAGIFIYVIIAAALLPIHTFTAFRFLFREPFIRNGCLRIALSLALAVLLIALWFQIHEDTNWGMPRYKYGPGP